MIIISIDSPIPVEESESGFEKATRIERYNSILSGCSKKPSSELVNALAKAKGKDGDCDYCMIFDVDTCCLHAQASRFGPRLYYKKMVEGGIGLQHGRLAFKAGVSNTSAKRNVLFIQTECQR